MKALTILSATLLAFSASALAQHQYPFQDPTLDAEKRIDNVLSLMTLDEKIASLGTSGVAVPRLGIRGTAIGEALSGVVLGGPMQTILAAFPDVPPEARTLPTPTTQFPQGVGLGRTWDPDLVHQAGAVIGSEARYIFENGKNAKAFLVLLTPNADLARDPRWGRTQESYGEDPFFNGTMAAALIRGIQGDNPKYTPSGTPASAISPASRSAVSEVCSAGLSPTQFPVASAGPSFHAAISSGKFHGMIWPTTPSGSRSV